MKILYFLTNYPFYSETFVSEEINQLGIEGHEVVVCNFTWYKKEQEAQQERIINNSKNPLKLFKSIGQNWFKSQSLFFNRKSLKYIGLCIKERPDYFWKYVYMLFSLDYMYAQVSQENFEIAISHFLFKSTLAGTLLCGKLEKPYHIRLHTKRSLYPEVILREVLNGASAITAESQDVGEHYQQFLSNPYEIKVIRQSINLKKLALLKPETMTKEHVEIMAIGRLVEKKGFEVLIEAIANCSAEVIDSIQLKIYGDGPLKEHLTSLIEDKNLNTTIKLMGKLDHGPLMKVLANAQMLIVPSIELQNDIDGVPTVIAEAMAVKTPVVATPIAGIKEMVADGITGFVVPENDSQSLANTISRLVLNPSEKTKVVDEAFNKVSKEYKLTLAEEIGSTY